MMLLFPFSQVKPHSHASHQLKHMLFVSLKSSRYINEYEKKKRATFIELFSIDFNGLISRILVFRLLEFVSTHCLTVQLIKGDRKSTGSLYDTSRKNSCCKPLAFFRTWMVWLFWKKHGTVAMARTRASWETYYCQGQVFQVNWTPAV